MKGGKTKQSGRSIQTSLFVGSLMREMGRLVADRDKMVRCADEYASQGCSQREIGELLSIDGFDKDLVETYLSSSASEPDSEHGPRWGFSVRGSCGDTVTHDDLNIEIRASTKEEAVLKLKDIMSREKDAGLEEILDVHEM